MAKRGLAVVVLTVAAFAARGALQVGEVEGRLRVLRDGVTLVSAMSVDRGSVDDSDVKSSFATLTDGTRVWNRWSEVKDRRFRLEVAERADGAVEITMSGQSDADSTLRTRMLNLDVPEAVFGGKAFRHIDPKVLPFRYAEATNDFASMACPFPAKFLAVDGLTFDFNPLGSGDESGQVMRGDKGNQLNRNGILGIWQVEKRDGGWRLSGGDLIHCPWGGFTGCKLVIREGCYEDFHRLHAMTSYFYNRQLQPLHLLAFASPQHGAQYADGDVPYAASRGYGWVCDEDGCARDAVVGNGSGAFYSALYGRRKDTYRFGPLPDGYYVFSFSAGNFTGVDNSFDLLANGESLLADVSVPKGCLRRFSKAIHVRGGFLDIGLSGRWLVSTMGLQPLMAEAEDYSIGRGFWVADGFEPCTLFRNENYRSKARFAAKDETEQLPVPGKECAAMPRRPPTPVERPAADDPRLAWLKTAKMQRLLDNSVSMSEFDEPGSLDRYMDREFAGKDVRVVMLSGMHSRHTYLGHLDRGIEAVRRMCGILHRRGVKVIDHHDSTLLWNDMAGFRVMMERLDETVLSLDTGLPSWQFCASNPRFCETYYAYLRRLVEAGVDGFQIDELEFWRHGCLCRHCRDAFRRDTGWEIPLNECDAEWTNPRSELRRRWQDWRVKAITNWFVELRRRVKDLRPDLVLSMYMTNDGFYYPYPWRNASSDVQDLGRVVNYFGAEMMSRSAMREGRNLLPLAKMRTAVSPAGSPPVWTWYYNVDYPTDYFAWGLSTMVGQIPLLSAVPTPPGGARYEAFGASRAAMSIDGATFQARVALLFPSHSRNWNEGRAFAYRSELFGTAQTLETMHIPYELISDEKLESGDLSKYRALFVGEAQCLSDREIAAVKAFAARGGKVRLSRTAGTRDEFGLPRSERAFGDESGLCYYEGYPASPFELDETWATHTWSFEPDESAEACFRQTLAEWTHGAVDWTIDAPSKVFTSVWREKSGSFVIHLLNGTGVNMKKGDPVLPDAPNPPFPALTSDVLITAPAGVCGAAVAVSPDFDGEIPLVVRNAPDGRKVFVLPANCLSAYTLVRIGDKERGL